MMAEIDRAVDFFRGLSPDHPAFQYGRMILDELERLRGVQEWKDVKVYPLPEDEYVMVLRNWGPFKELKMAGSRRAPKNTSHWMRLPKY